MCSVKQIVGGTIGFVTGGPAGAIAGAMIGSGIDQIELAQDAAKAQAAAQAAAQNAALTQQQQELQWQQDYFKRAEAQMNNANQAANTALTNQINQQNAAMALYQNQINSLMSQQSAAANKQPEIQVQPGVGAGGRRSGITPEQTGGGGGAGGTMLTGPMGVDPSQLTLGRKTLLGG